MSSTSPLVWSTSAQTTSTEMHQTVLTLVRNLVGAYIESEDPWPEHGLLTYLKMPSLQEIAFYLQDDDPNPPDSSRALRFSLRLRPRVELLEKYPSLTELAIIIHDLNEVVDDDNYAFQHQTDVLISQLTAPSLPTGDAAPVPQLSGIYFGSMDRSYIDLDCSLYLQVLRHSGLCNDATLSALDALRQAGRDISFLEGEEASRVTNRGARRH
ncbi:hypothetical protein C8R44DRAFT_876177 [Mycena epipterygia]|nr:hypothetical protein C8R44DRAFT_876177 [Mycena epipterygia]